MKQIVLFALLLCSIVAAQDTLQDTTVRTVSFILSWGGKCSTRAALPIERTATDQTRLHFLPFLSCNLASNDTEQVIDASNLVYPVAASSSESDKAAQAQAVVALRVSIARFNAFALIAVAVMFSFF